MVKFIDLFAGIGGMRLGFSNYNTQCVFSSEWDKHAQKTYEANFGEIPYGDITKIKEDEIPPHDLLLAGFPCQPFSMIGKWLGFADETQGTLFFDIVRIAKYHKPKVVFLENVPGLLTLAKGDTFQQILKILDEIDYNVYYEVLDASEFGLPQIRKRIIIGIRKDIDKRSFKFPVGKKRKDI